MGRTKILSEKVKEEYSSLLSMILADLKESRSNKLTFNVDFSFLREAYYSAKNTSDLNDYMISEKANINDAVRVYECLDVSKNKLVRYGILAEKENTLKTFFILEILKSQYATLDEFKKFRYKYQ